MKFAMFGLRRKTLYCSQHAPEGLVNIVNVKRCKAEGCDKHPTYGLEGATRAEYCLRHTRPGMINMKDRRCAGDNCKRQPSFGMPGAKVGVYCLQHALDGMINVIRKPCAGGNDCRRVPFFNMPGSSVSMFCSTHKTDGMVDVKTRRCAWEGCRKHPSYGRAEGTRKSAVFCANHAAGDMVRIARGHTCEGHDCSKVPVYGKPGTTHAMFCAGHRHDTPGLVNVRRKSCARGDCAKRPTFGPPGGKRVLCCGHAEVGMVNLEKTRKDSTATAATSGADEAQVAAMPRRNTRAASAMFTGASGNRHALYRATTCGGEGELSGDGAVRSVGNGDGGGDGESDELQGRGVLAEEGNDGGLLQPEAVQLAAPGQVVGIGSDWPAVPGQAVGVMQSVPGQAVGITQSVPGQAVGITPSVPGQAVEIAHTISGQAVGIAQTVPGAGGGMKSSSSIDASSGGGVSDSGTHRKLRSRSVRRSSGGGGGSGDCNHVDPQPSSGYENNPKENDSLLSTTSSSSSPPSIATTVVAVEKNGSGFILSRAAEVVAEGPLQSHVATMAVAAAATLSSLKGVQSRSGNSSSDDHESSPPPSGARAGATTWAAQKEQHQKQQEQGQPLDGDTEDDDDLGGVRDTDDHNSPASTVAPAVDADCDGSGKTSPFRADHSGTMKPPGSSVESCLSYRTAVQGGDAASDVDIGDDENPPLFPSVPLPGVAAAAEPPARSRPLPCPDRLSSSMSSSDPAAAASRPNVKSSHLRHDDSNIRMVPCSLTAIRPDIATSAAPLSLTAPAPRPVETHASLHADKSDLLSSGRAGSPVASSLSSSPSSPSSLSPSSATAPAPVAVATTTVISTTASPLKSQPPLADLWSSYSAAPCKVAAAATASSAVEGRPSHADDSMTPFTAAAPAARSPAAPTGAAASHPRVAFCPSPAGRRPPIFNEHHPSPPPPPASGSSSPVSDHSFWADGAWAASGPVGFRSTPSPPPPPTRPHLAFRPSLLPGFRRNSSDEESAGGDHDRFHAAIDDAKSGGRSERLSGQKAKGSDCDDDGRTGAETHGEKRGKTSEQSDCNGEDSGHDSDHAAPYGRGRGRSKRLRADVGSGRGRAGGRRTRSTQRFPIEPRVSANIR